MRDERVTYRTPVRRSREADPAASDKIIVWTAPSDGAVSPPIGSKTVIHWSSDWITISNPRNRFSQISSLSGSTKTQTRPEQTNLSGVSRNAKEFANWGKWEDRTKRVNWISKKKWEWRGFGKRKQIRERELEIRRNLERERSVVDWKGENYQTRLLVLGTCVCLQLSLSFLLFFLIFFFFFCFCCCLGSGSAKMDRAPTLRGKYDTGKLINKLISYKVKQRLKTTVTVWKRLRFFLGSW